MTIISCPNANDVTSQLTSIGAPECIDIYYSPTLDRMVYTTGQDSSHFFSNIGDPANIQSPDNILGVDSGTGGATLCFKEMENGELLSLKAKGGYSITPSVLSPSNWNVSRRWQGRGPVGPKAADVGPDFLLIFTRNGPWRYYEGTLTWIGREKRGTWDRVNWAAETLISVVVDDDNKVAHFLLPLDGSSVPNKDVKLDYFMGWEDPVMLTYTGDVIPNRFGRRWSEDDLPARCGKLVTRQLATPVDTRVNDKQQLLFGMDGAGGPGHVDFHVPDVFDDNGAGIDWQYQPGFIQSQILEMIRWAQIKGRARGAGPLYLTQVTDDPTYQVKPLLDSLAGYDDAEEVQREHESRRRQRNARHQFQ